MKEKGACIVCGHVEAGAVRGPASHIAHCQSCLRVDGSWVQLYKDAALEERIGKFQAVANRIQGDVDVLVGYLEAVQSATAERAKASRKRDRLTTRVCIVCGRLQSASVSGFDAPTSCPRCLRADAMRVRLYREVGLSKRIEVLQGQVSYFQGEIDGLTELLQALRTLVVEDPNVL